MPMILTGGYLVIAMVASFVFGGGVSSALKEQKTHRMDAYQGTIYKIGVDYDGTTVSVCKEN